MAGIANFGGKQAKPFGAKGNTGKKTASQLRAQAKKMVKDNMAAGNTKNNSDTKKLPPNKSKAAIKRESLNFSNVDLATLSTKARKALPASTFVFPGKRAYPIPDKRHAANALARSAGKPEHAAVVAAVNKKFGKKNG